MPQAAIASSPALLAAAPARGAGAPEKSGAGSVEGPNSFSSVLNRQTQQPAKNDTAGKPATGKEERPAGESAANAMPPAPARPAEASQADGKIAKAAKAAETAGESAAAQPATDAIALLAGMLAGITTPSSSAANDESTVTPGLPGETTVAEGVTPIAAPLAAAVAAATTPQTKGQGQGEAAAIQADTGRTALDSHTQAGNSGGDAALPATPAADTAKEAAANLAATPQVDAADGKRSQGAKHENFDAMLAAARATANAHGDASLHAANKADTAHPTPQVATPVGQAGWANEVGEKLTWMVGNLNSKADFVLTPPQMGRIEVSLTVSGDQASATFIAANPAVREALENAVPRLREMLNDAGINLGQAHVGAEAFRQQAQQGEGGDNRNRGDQAQADGGDAGIGAMAASSGGSRWLRAGNGLVDTFA